MKPSNKSRMVARKYLKKLSSATESSLETMSTKSLTSEHAKEAREKAAAMIRQETGDLNSEQETDLDTVFMKYGTEALARLNNDGENAELAIEHVEALEAIVESDGSRPTLAVTSDDKINVDDDSLGVWKDPARSFASSIESVLSAVGRIDLDGKHCGTGFVVKHGLVLTNRHVLQELAEEDAPENWRFRGQPSITFDTNPQNSRERQFKIQNIITAGKDFIDRHAVDYKKLDFAVLACEVPIGSPFPEPLPLESERSKIVVGRPVYTVGYPAKPFPGSYPFEVLNRLFAYKFGVKRFAPGEIDRGLGTPGSDDGETVFTHDATTLAGNSGSCVVDFGDDGLLVAGLHFAGKAEEENYAHSNALLRTVLANLNLTWQA